MVSDGKRITQHRVRHRWMRAHRPEKSQKEIGRLARLRGGADDGPVVLAQHFEPGRDVISMTHRRHDTEGRAAEGGVHLGHQFFEGVFLRAKGAGEIAVEAGGAPLACPSSWRAVRCQLIGSK